MLSTRLNGRKDTLSGNAIAQATGSQVGLDEDIQRRRETAVLTRAVTLLIIRFMGSCRQWLE